MLKAGANGTEHVAQTLCSWERGQLATPWGQGVPRHQGSVPSSVKGNPEGPSPHHALISP